MRAFVASFAFVVLSLFAAPAARAEGLVQITLHGAIEPAGGAPVEVELEVWDGEKVELLTLNLHLGQGTRARDLASLIVTRLRRLQARVDFPDEHAAGAEASEHTTLFVEALTGVHLRLGHGMHADVTLCDAAPISLRMLPPQVVAGAAQVRIAVTTFEGHSRTIGRDAISLTVGADMGAAQIAERLASTALDRGWIADRPRPDSWSCSRNTDGATVTGCSIELESPDADWRLEVKLAVPQKDPLDQ